MLSRLTSGMKLAEQESRMEPVPAPTTLARNAQGQHTCLPGLPFRLALFGRLSVGPAAAVVQANLSATGASEAARPMWPGTAG